MKKLYFSFTIALILVGVVSCSSRNIVNADYRVIPLPKSIIMSESKSFELKPSTVISYPEGGAKLATTAELLAEYIAEFTGIKLKITDNDRTRNVIRLRTGFDSTSKEAYKFTVDAKAIEITGSSSAGVFYGAQTLRKSLPIIKDRSRIIFSSVQIEDAPRFHYRGMHLDVARHMFPVKFIKKYIDLLALHNINTFHWHLTDDQGWRIEIRKYPKLVQVASQRKATLISHWEKPNHKYDETPYGGYYTQAEIRDIVTYAAQRHIDIIPEIDLPGHMLAALTAYPELGCTGGPYETGTRWGVYDDVLCAGNDKVYEFLEGVFSEIIELFPGKYVHIGGDECPKVRWKRCPKCQARIRAEKITAHGKRTREEQLQSYMMSRVADFLEKNGRKVIGWDEILEGGGVKDATIMSWRGTEGGVAAARSGLNAIMVPFQYLYLDYAQSKDEGEPLSIGGDLPVEKVYGYEPVAEELADDPALAAHIIGVQGNLWTEYFRTPEVVEYMVIPRIDALSEIQWIDHRYKDYDDFLLRLDHMRAIYDRLGYTYALHVFDREKPRK